MYPNVALGDLASCGTRQVRAKLFGRVHRLCLVLHIYRMPLNASFFKSSFPFHRLVGLYPLNDDNDNKEEAQSPINIEEAN